MMRLFVGGALGTILLTTVLAASQGMRLTRMNLPYLLGTMLTPRRDRAALVGFGVHALNGWVFALLYFAAFRSLGLATWWLGALLGMLHAAFVLTVGMVLLPGMHPRMASETAGPTPVRQLEPPGFLALHYGRATPLSVVAAHVLFGIVLAITCR
jgi:hypothetical protein